MRIVFMGTPSLAATVLQALAKQHEVVGVFTRPDAVRGRGKKLVGSPVKDAANELGLEVHTPLTLKDDQTISLVRELAPDAICVAAYGALLPKEVLDIPQYGCLNVHTSLLPRWRGAAPIERAILARDEMAGVCIMKMQEGLDTGPYCLCESIPIGRKYVNELAGDLANAGAAALCDALDKIQAGTAEWTEQGDDGVTYASKIQKGELDCVPTDSVEAAQAKVRAASDSHPSRIVIADRQLAVEEASVVSDDAVIKAVGDMQAGEATSAMKRLFIAFDDGVLELERVKPAGKKSMDGRSFVAGVQGMKGAKIAWGTV